MQAVFNIYKNSVVFFCFSFFLYNIYYLMIFYELGTILTIKDNIIVCDGLHSCFLGEVIHIHNELGFTGVTGMIMNLEYDCVRIILLHGKQSLIYAGDEVRRTFKGIETIAGFNVLGSVINPLGNSLEFDTIDDTYFDLHNLNEYEFVNI